MLQSPLSAEKKDVLVIVGPTASGKTALSVALAKVLQGEVISADSMAIYRYMDIGTAKPSLSEQAGVPHHLIDVVSPEESFSVVQFKEMAESVIDRVHQKNCIPVIAGGTGLYVNSLCYNVTFAETASNDTLRNELSQLADENGAEWLHAQLAEIDPVSASRIHPNNIRRVIRAIEVFRTTGVRISEQQEVSRTVSSPYRFHIIGLQCERSLLVERINRRVEDMIAHGLVEEVQSLLNRGYTRDMQSMQAIGYKELVNYLENHISLSEAIEQIKIGSRQYAKRQMTWFQKLDGVKWLRAPVDKSADLERCAKEVLETLAID